jgi:hypothetical protein
MNATTLVNQYKRQLDEYNSLYSEYTEFLNSEADSFITVANNKFLGTSLAVKSPVESAKTCKALCASFSGCTGATFKSKNKLCLLQQGDGGLEVSSNTTAIIKQKQYYLLKLKEKNNQVKAALQQLQNYYDANRDKLTNDLAEKSYAINSYSDNLLMLDNQNRELTNQLQNVTFVDSEIESSESDLNHQKAKFQLLGMLLLVVIGFILYTGFFSSSSSSSSSSAVAASPVASQST